MNLAGTERPTRRSWYRYRSSSAGGMPSTRRILVSTPVNFYNCIRSRVFSEPTRLFADILQQLNALKAKLDDQKLVASTIGAFQKELAGE
jgi:hypothetical protein